MYAIVQWPKVYLYPSPVRLTLLTFILVKLLYDIGAGQDVWQAARVFRVFPTARPSAGNKSSTSEPKLLHHYLCLETTITV